MTWLRVIAFGAYLAGFLFAWQCWTTAREPAKAVGWLGAASVAFWIGRFASRVGTK